MPKPFGLANLAEQQVVKHLRVRLITEEERPRWNVPVCAHRLSEERHDGRPAALLRGRISGQWVVVVRLERTGPVSAPRNAWAGWSKEQSAAGRDLRATT
jgi:hypothetical protein